MNKLLLSLVISLVFISSNLFAQDYKPSSSADRSTVPDVYKWDLTHMFASDAHWKAEKKGVQEAIDVFKGYCEGKMGNYAKLFEYCYSLYYDLARRSEKLQQYAYFKLSENQEIPASISMFDESNIVKNEFHSKTSFFKPEMTSLGEKKVLGFIEEIPSLEAHRHVLMEYFRLGGHVLSKEEEAVKAKAGDILSAPESMQSSIEVDTKWRKDVNIQEWVKKRTDKNRGKRKDAAVSFLNSLRDYGNIWARNLYTALQGFKFKAETSNYDTVLEMQLDEPGVPVSVFNNLIEVVGEKLPQTLHRYVTFKKKVLKLGEHKFYDNYANMFPDYKSTITYSESRNNIANALELMSSEYVNNFNEGSDPANGWIDVYPNKFKGSGAYNWGVYGVHPYIMLNHNDDYRDMFTIAHEFGHAMHSYFSSKTHPYAASEYPIFHAEIASTTNEMLLYEYLIEKSNSREEKLFLYDSLLDMIRQTLMRQTQFSEFEVIAHEKVMNGEPLNLKSFNDIYIGLIKKYYGEKDFTLMESGEYYDKEKTQPKYLDSIEWAFVSQFYRGFYVYTYATGVAAAISFAKGLKDGSIGVDSYLEFLKSGGSDFPCDVLKRAGVDLTSREPVSYAMDYFSDVLDKFEKLYFQKK